jgi:hypothetical protein
MFTIKSDHRLSEVGCDIIKNDDNNKDDNSDEINVED